MEGRFIKGCPVVSGTQQPRHAREPGNRTGAPRLGIHGAIEDAARSEPAAAVRRSVTGPSGVVNAIHSPSGRKENDGSPVPRRRVPSVCCRL